MRATIIVEYESTTPTTPADWERVIAAGLEHLDRPDVWPYEVVSVEVSK